jgi:hypothetical protein
VQRRRSLSAVLVLLLGVGAASCAGEDQTGTPSHQVSAWVKSSGFGEDIGTLVADNARIAEETSAGGMHDACEIMDDDAGTALDELPILGAPQVTDWLSTAYKLEATAATDCYKAGVTNKKLLTTAEEDGKKADGLYTRALIAIQSIDGRLPTTTTTTDNTPGNILG